MDEAKARALLERLAADETPSHVDITAARALGRRWRRRRRIALSATSLTAVAAATAVALSGVIPLAAGGHGAGQPASAARRAPVTPQSTFNVLVPYASFGWLPPGFSLSAGVKMGVVGGPFETTQMLDMEAGSPATDHEMDVTVWAAGACQLRNHMSASQVKLKGGPPYYYSTRYHRRLAGRCAGMPLAAAAPAVAGDPAFWTPIGGLVWEYAPGSWALLAPRYSVPGGSGFWRWRYRANIGWRTGVKLAGHPATVQSAHTRALLLKVAAGIRFGGTTPVPFGFRLDGLPGAWQPQQATYTTSGGRLVGSSLTESSASSPYNLYVAVSPTGSHPCDGPPPGTPKARSLTSIFGPSMCKTSYRGMTVRIGLMPGKRLWRKRSRPSPPVTPISVFRHLRVLGPDPANWTTSPLG